MALESRVMGGRFLVGENQWSLESHCDGGVVVAVVALGIIATDWLMTFLVTSTGMLTVMVGVAVTETATARVMALVTLAQYQGMTDRAHMWICCTGMCLALTGVWRA